MREILYILAVLMAGCNALSDFPGPVNLSQNDAGSDSSIQADAATDVGDRDLATPDMRPACGQPKAPTRPEFVLSEIGATLDAGDTASRVTTEVSPHADHYDWWIGFATVEGPMLHVIHGNAPSTQTIEFTTEESAQRQDAMLWRSGEGVHFSVLRGRCDEGVGRISPFFVTFASSDADPVVVESGVDCLENQSRVVLPAFRGGYNAFDPTQSTPLWWMWFEDGIGVSAVENPEDAYQPQSTWRRVDARAFTGPRGESYSTGGRLAFWATDFDIGQYETRWMDATEDEDMYLLDVRVDGRRFSVVHLRDEIYLTAHRDSVENHVELRLYEHQPAENRLVRIDAFALELFQNEVPDILDLAVFEDGAVLVEWLDDEAGDRSRVTALEFDLASPASVRAVDTWEWQTSNRTIVDVETRAIRDGCDLLVSVSTMIRVNLNYEVDHLVYRYENYASEAE